MWTFVLSRIVLSRIASTAISGTLLFGLTSCGGSAATTMTSPTAINRCGISMQGVDAPLPAEGATASIIVTAARECAWSASVEGSWLSIKSGVSGQGDGTVEFAATANPDPQMRRGAITANGQRTEITQTAGTCEITLGQSSASFNQGGGSGQVPVRASSSMCGWSASADADWIQLRSASGQGTGTVSFDVPPSTEPPRSAIITIAGQKFSITQSEGCAFAIAPASRAVPPAGGTGTIAVTTTATCPWTASSNVSWLTVNPPTGRGPGSVTFSVAATTGRSRIGTAIVAGQLFTVTQSQGCSYSVQPSSGQIGSGGGTLPVNVSTNAECDWSATSNDDWITLQGRTSGSGDGTVTLAVAATSGPARSGSATVAGQRVTVTQSPGCAFTISPESANAPSSASTGKVTVTTSQGCAWTASSSAPWLTVTSGSSGSGNGEVQYAVAATSGPSRGATMTIAGRTFTLNQGQGCAFTLSPPAATLGDDGGPGMFTVQTSAGCAWSATSAVPWLTITSGASGTGEGAVRFTAARNTGPARSGAITAAGQTFTVTQGDGCALSLSESSFAAPAGGGTGSVNVIAGSGCGWTATSNASWLSITSGANGTGNGSVAFTVAANSGPGRSGTLTIGGRTFTVSQGENCSFSIAPDHLSPSASATNTSVNLTAPAGCGWSASSNAPWISVNPASGTGSGGVQITIQANSGAARTGTATIAGQTFTVNQAGGCSYSITPSSQPVAASGGSVSVVVSTAGGCGWTAISQAPWLVISSGANGSGGGAVQVDVQPNTGPQRSGTASIAGQTFTVVQDSGCSFVVAPQSVNTPAAGGGARIDVSTAASCAWTAVSGAGWITVTAGGAGSGSGAVDLSFAANPGPGRSGTTTVAGRTVTVTQESGCTYSLGSTSQMMPATGGVGSVSVAASTGCPWTAVSGASWVTITDGASGSGAGTVQFSVEPNATGAARSATLTIAGIGFTVTQQ